MVVQKYSKLLEPLQIKNVKLKNRIVKSAQWFIYAEPDGSVGPRLLGWYEALAKGGVGLVTVEESICEFPVGASNVPHIRLDDDQFLPGLTRLAEVIHRHDCPCFVQITHAGPAHNPDASGGMQPVAPSAVEPPTEPQMAPARALSNAEVKEMVEKFARAAERCFKAGFDGVEMHYAHYALGNAFLSRIQNQRDDEYGPQSLENRARFGTEVIKRVRELTTPEYVIGVRLNCMEWGHGLGTTSEEAAQFARMFEAVGCDYIQASAYGYGPMALCALPNLVIYPEVPPGTEKFAKRIATGALIPEASIVKNAVNIPVSGVGNLTFEAAEKVLAEGKVDLVCFGRQFMADTEFPKKLAEGRDDDIRECLGCTQCLHVMLLNQPVECRINIFAGKETELELLPASSKKKVMVIGAGPAGLEAARVAALRGHEVSIHDKAKEIGGLLGMATFIKGTEVDDLPKLVNYYQKQLKRLKVKVNLGREVTAALVTREKPDVVIVAGGGKPEVPDILVEAGAKLVTTEQLKAQAKGFLRFLSADAMAQMTKVFLPVGKDVVVVGSDLAGLEAAEFLVKRGKQVTVIDEAPAPFEGVLIHWLVRLMPWLEAKGVVIYNGVKYGKVTSRGIDFTTAEGEDKTISADTVMVVNSYGRNEALYDALEGIVSERYLIGDAARDKTEYIKGAIYDGARVALKI